MSGVKPAQFQEAAIAHIVRRLRDPRGSGRMLLADEVGLGKTVVARGVIERMAQGRRSFRVIYLCSNAEIADQNRSKLDPSGGHSVRRVTQLALKSGQEARVLDLYAFTPGTSLKEGTGLAWERQMIMFLIYRLYGDKVWVAPWREFFRCSAGEERWRWDTRRRNLRVAFQRKTDHDFQEALRAEWSQQGGVGDANSPGPGRGLLQIVREAVATFDSRDATQRQARNRLIGQLRAAMQRVAVRTLKADLVILDEVQRFREVLDKAKDPTHIANTLFATGAPVLILSATPYRALSLRHEQADEAADDHYRDFFATLQFLFNADDRTPRAIRTNLAQFGKRLQDVEHHERIDEQLLELKNLLERELRKVICRTERNWYVQDRRNGVDEALQPAKALPTRLELEEYMLLHKYLGRELGSTSQVMEFWKCAPSMLTFLDAGYALLRHIRDKRVRVPRQLLSAATDVGALEARNFRMAQVIRQGLGDGGELPSLWMAPTYTYYADRYFGEAPRSKLLVFSGWRFVPKAIAIVVSQAASTRLGATAEDPRQPLKVSDHRSFHVFDLCFPSPALAALANPKDVRAHPEGARRDPSALVEQATRDIGARLREIGVAVVASGGDSIWRVIARLERHSRDQGGAMREAVAALMPDRDEPSEGLALHRDLLRRWLADDGAVSISRRRLRWLAQIAVFSPANAVLRALQSVHGAEQAGGAIQPIVRLCFGPLRHYLNRPHVQVVVRSHQTRMKWTSTRRGAESGYAARVLQYAADAHLQAVLDEYAYLQKHAGQAATINDAIDQLGRVFGLSSGTPRTNGAGGEGPTAVVRTDEHTHNTHYALAFGDETTEEAGLDDESVPLRKSAIREAFNSPFWPFVLATTSVGQEGLDFHLYCRDIFHWNLPSNPVDLEQREGRINRRDCLAVRMSIARDWPLHDAQTAERLKAPDVNPWAAVFARVAGDENEQRYKHGLYPHWVYECRQPDKTVRIRRHVPVFASSRDAFKYEELKTGLALYRLVFGQANQEDLIQRLSTELAGVAPEQRDRVLKRLRSYMLNLSPIGEAEIVRQAHAQVTEMLRAHDAPRRIKQLVDDVRQIRVHRGPELAGISGQLDALEKVAVKAIDGHKVASTSAIRRALVALEYLRNPYDRVFDSHVEGGFADDIEIVRRAARGTGDS